ncbi:epidermal retinol dehydrogenase 2-like [Liolophura sinensis]|uniref:epidermal retinol dehydrogenase 2-like n=1 Tax=Liolophura sinensis TaxID=3198878 RepID=UPI0031591F32
MAEIVHERSLATQLFQLVRVLFLTVFYIIEGVILALIPKSLRQRKSVNNEIVLVTGAGSGIGRLLSIKFARLGCRLVLWDINESGNQETADEVKKYGARVYAYTVDLSKRDEVYKTAEQVKKDVGDVDILVNNAGIVTGKKYLQCPDNLIIKTMEVNAMAHFWTVKAFLPKMLEKNHGHIVSIASAAGLVGVTGLADYCASKFAAVGFDESLRYELDAMKKNGIHTTVVCPYYINTGMFTGVKCKLIPLLEPEYVVTTIMDGILMNQSTVYIPRTNYLFILLKHMLPTKASMLVADVLGMNSAMDEFVGREKVE